MQRLGSRISSAALAAVLFSSCTSPNDQLAREQETGSDTTDSEQNTVTETPRVSHVIASFDDTSLASRVAEVAKKVVDVVRQHDNLLHHIIFLELSHDDYKRSLEPRKQHWYPPSKSTTFVGTETSTAYVAHPQRARAFIKAEVTYNDSSQIYCTFNECTREKGTTSREPMHLDVTVLDLGATPDQSLADNLPIYWKGGEYKGVKAFERTLNSTSADVSQAFSDRYSGVAGTTGNSVEFRDYGADGLKDVLVIREGADRRDLVDSRTLRDKSGTYTKNVNDMVMPGSIDLTNREYLAVLEQVRAQVSAGNKRLASRAEELRREVATLQASYAAQQGH